jgi:hypothetical protein
MRAIALSRPKTRTRRHPVPDPRRRSASRGCRAIHGVTAKIVTAARADTPYSFATTASTPISAGYPKGAFINEFMDSAFPTDELKHDDDWTTAEKRPHLEGLNQAAWAECGFAPSIRPPLQASKPWAIDFADWCNPIICNFGTTCIFVSDVSRSAYRPIRIGRAGSLHTKVIGRLRCGLNENPRYPDERGRGGI